MEISDFVNQFLKLQERERDQKIWEMWLVNLPYMNMGHLKEVSYEEMLNTAKQQEVNQEVVTNGVYVDQACF